MSPPDDKRPTGQFDLTPNTHVRLTLTRVIGVVGVLGIIVATAVSTYTNLTTTMHAHITDDARHLPEHFPEHHGTPAGMWDVETIHREDKEMSDGVKKSIDELTLTPLHFEDCYCAGREVRCRIRH